MADMRYEQHRNTTLKHKASTWPTTKKGVDAAKHKSEQATPYLKPAFDSVLRAAGHLPRDCGPLRPQTTL